MTKYRAAIIGLGRMGSTIKNERLGEPRTSPYSHMACYLEVPAVKVVVGADPYPEQREDFRERWGVESVYADYREMLERERPDIVSVTTSAKPRAAIVIDCAQSGVKAIFAEKPMSLSLAEADAMVAACRDNRVTLAMGATRNWDLLWGRVRESIDAGDIGRVLQVNGYGRGGLSHMGSHLLPLVLYLAGGEVQWVFGEMESDEKAAGDDDLMGIGYLAFDNEVRAFIRSVPTGGAHWEFDVIGETGRFHSIADASEIEFWQTQVGEERGMFRRLLTRPQHAQSNGVRAVQDIVRCLETGGEPRCSGEDGRAALEIAIALRESHRQGGRRIDLPLADRSLLIRSSETLSGDLPTALRRKQPTQSANP